MLTEHPAICISNFDLCIAHFPTRVTTCMMKHRSKAIWPGILETSLSIESKLGEGRSRDLGSAFAYLNSLVHTNGHVQSASRELLGQSHLFPGEVRLHNRISTPYPCVPGCSVYPASSFSKPHQPEVSQEPHLLRLFSSCSRPASFTCVHRVRARVRRKRGAHSLAQ